MQAKSGEAVKPRQSLIQLTDESLNHEISTKLREVTSLQAGLEQCRAKAEVEISLQRKDVDDDLLRTRLEAAKYLRESYAAKFEHVTLRNLAKESGSGRWLAATPDLLSQPERIFNSIPAEPVAIPDEMRFSAVMRQELARNLAEVNKVQSEFCEHHIAELEKLRKDLPEMIRKAAGVDVAEAKLAQVAEQLEAAPTSKSWRCRSLHRDMALSDRTPSMLPIRWESAKLWSRFMTVSGRSSKWMSRPVKSSNCKSAKRSVWTSRERIAPAVSSSSARKLTTATTTPTRGSPFASVPPASCGRKLPSARRSACG